MAKSPSFQFYPADFLADENVQLMTDAQVGIYIKLICICWREGSLPADVDKLARIGSKNPRTFKKHWDTIKDCFIPDPENELRIVHPRLLNELKKQKKFSDDQRKKAESRWGRDKGNATALPRHQSGNALQSSSSSSSSSSGYTPPTPSHPGSACVFTEYIKKSQNPNMHQFTWVSGLVETCISEIRTFRPDMTDDNILACWKETCDEASAKAVGATKWYRTTFIGKCREFGRASPGRNYEPKTVVPPYWSA